MYENLTTRLWKKFESEPFSECRQEKVLLELDPLTRIHYARTYGSILTEVTKLQREILSLLNIPLPSST